MDIHTQKWLDRWQKDVLDTAAYAGLELMHDDWRVVMKECARSGLVATALMAEQRCDRLLDEIRTRNEASTLFYDEDSR